MTIVVYGSTEGSRKKNSSTNGQAIKRREGVFPRIIGTYRKILWKEPQIVRILRERKIIMLKGSRKKCIF